MSLTHLSLTFRRRCEPWTSTELFEARSLQATRQRKGLLEGFRRTGHYRFKVNKVRLPEIIIKNLPIYQDAADQRVP